jgi:hypothetical protein
MDVPDTQGVDTAGGNGPVLKPMSAARFVPFEYWRGPSLFRRADVWCDCGVLDLGSILDLCTESEEGTV